VQPSDHAKHTKWSNEHAASDSDGEAERRKNKLLSKNEERANSNAQLVIHSGSDIPVAVKIITAF
jgi:hypothetical protein